MARQSTRRVINRIYGPGECVCQGQGIVRWGGRNILGMRGRIVCRIEAMGIVAPLSRRKGTRTLKGLYASLPRYSIPTLPPIPSGVPVASLSRSSSSSRGRWSFEPRRRVWVPFQQVTNRVLGGLGHICAVMMATIPV